MENNPIDDIEISFINADGIKNISQTDDCLIVTDDIITDIDISRLIDFHKSKNADATLVTRTQYSATEYGFINTDELCRATDFILYEDNERSVSHNYFMGMMLLSKGSLKENARNIQKHLHKYSIYDIIYA